MTNEWWKQYGINPPPLGAKVETAECAEIWDEGEKVGVCTTGRLVEAEVVEIGAHWSDQPRGRSGYWVRLRTIAEAMR